MTTPYPAFSLPPHVGILADTKAGPWFVWDVSDPTAARRIAGPFGEAVEAFAWFESYWRAGQTYETVPDPFGGELFE